MKLISLFDGIGGFPLAWCNVTGQRPADLHYQSSEIEPWPMAVVRARFPNVEELGSVTDIDPTEIIGEPSDEHIMTFGSPCQDLSVAGKRAGLAGERSGLFHAAMRIIRDVRPRYAIWENVAGAFSSNDGDDFAEVLRCFADIGYDACWTTLDAQWFGVPQRRRRVFLVGCRDGIPAGCDIFSFGRRSGAVCRDSVQLVRKGRSGDTEAGREAGSPVAALTASGVGVGGPDMSDAQAGHLIMAHGQPNAEISDAACPTLNCDHEQPIAMICKNQRGEVREMPTSSAVSSGGGKPGQGYPLAFQPMSFYGQMKAESQCHRTDGTANTLVNGTCPGHQNHIMDTTIRRLTPTECLRLQGYPDNWFDGVDGYSDTKAYRAIGNSVAIPCVEWVFRQVLEFDKQQSAMDWN